MNPTTVAIIGFGIVILLTVIDNTISVDMAGGDAGHLFGYEEKLFQDDGSRTFTRRLHQPPMVMNGAPDFIVRDQQGEPVVLELKSGQRNSDQFEGHRMQVLMYLWILKEAFDEPVNRGEIIYLEDDTPEGRVQIKMDAGAEQEFMDKVIEFYQFWHEKVYSRETAGAT